MKPAHSRRGPRRVPAEKRRKNPAFLLGMNPPIQAMVGSINASGIDKAVLDLTASKVGQMNGCEQ